VVAVVAVVAVVVEVVVLVVALVQAATAWHLPVQQAQTLTSCAFCALSRLWTSSQ
jgi:hypothetical protein